MCRSEIYIIIDINCLIWAHSSHQCCGSFVIVTLLSPSKFFLYDDKNQNVSLTQEREKERDRGMNQFNFGKESMSIFILQSYSRVLLFFSRLFAPLSLMLSLLLGTMRYSHIRDRNIFHYFNLYAKIFVIKSLHVMFIIKCYGVAGKTSPSLFLLLLGASRHVDNIEIHSKLLGTDRDRESARVASRRGYSSNWQKNN